jgi:allophanate hydrolase subunit 2
MSDNIFSISGGFVFPAKERLYGFQDKGVTLGGAQDQLSFQTAYTMFNKPKCFKAVEMIYPAKITATTDMLLIICGSSYQNTTHNGVEIAYNTIQFIKKGSLIEFSGTKKGFRTLVFAIEIKSKDQLVLVGKTRNEEIKKFIIDNYRENTIRVIKGPEYNILQDTTLFENNWEISPNSSQMGISLKGVSIPVNSIEMISQPVVGGVIQLSPNGPIVLMRHRQTVGGYPRIATIIESDIDKLSQFNIGSHIKFKLIDFEAAIDINRKYKKLFI